MVLQTASRERATHLCCPCESSPFSRRPPCPSGKPGGPTLSGRFSWEECSWPLHPSPFLSAAAAVVWTGNQCDLSLMTASLPELKHVPFHLCCPQSTIRGTTLLAPRRACGCTQPSLPHTFPETCLRTADCDPREGLGSRRHRGYHQQVHSPFTLPLHVSHEQTASCMHVCECVGM